MAATRQAFVGAGANLGDRAATLRAAVEDLRATREISLVETSAVYETAPVGVTDQPMFLNLVIGLETTLAPEALLQLLLALEQKHGRVRGARWGPRTLDLDLLVFEGEARARPELQLPHPRMFEREFVTVPLRELLQRPPFRNAAWASLRQRLGPADGSSGGFPPAP